MLPTKVPAADSHREELRRAREDATAALMLTAESMKAHFDQHARDTPVFEPGQKVWLDTRNLRVTEMPRKLVDRYAGPYPVVHRVGNLAMNSVYQKTYPSIQSSMCCCRCHTSTAHCQAGTHQSLHRLKWKEKRSMKLSGCWSLAATDEEGSSSTSYSGRDGPQTRQLGACRKPDPCCTACYGILYATPNIPPLGRADTTLERGVLLRTASLVLFISFPRHPIVRSP